MNKKKVQLNIGICDDEPLMLEQLQEICNAVLGEDYALQIDSARSAERFLSSENPFQIALLDVRLLEGSGIELAREIMARNPKCRIIFVSGYLTSVSAVYDVPHFCFVLKDQLEDQLPRFLKRAAQLAAKEAGETILVAVGRKMEPLLLSDISFLERRGHWTFLNLIDGSVWETREKLGDLLDRIHNSDFLRCHISYAVNLQDSVSMEGRTFTMRSGAQIPVSRPHEEEARNAFFRHLSEQLS